MAIEKKWQAVPPQSITVSGTTDGKISVANSTLFKVKQKVFLFSDTLQPIEFQVKRINDSNQLELGSAAKDILNRSDLSGYTVGDNSKIKAEIQDRNTISGPDIQRAVYDEEPTVAIRTVLVGPDGSRVDTVKGTDGTNRLATEGDVIVLNSIVRAIWDQVTVTSKNDDGDPLVITYKLDSVLVATVTIIYDVDGDFEDYQVVYP